MISTHPLHRLKSYLAILSLFMGLGIVTTQAAPGPEEEVSADSTGKRADSSRVDLDTSKAPSRGAQGATITISSFADFQCPFSKGLLPVYSRLGSHYQDQVRFTFHQFPLSEAAQKAAEASLCAAAQGKFWEMHDSIFARPQEVSVEDLKQRSRQLELNASSFDKCLDDDTMREAVRRDVEMGRAIGVVGTPAIFINGRPVPLSADTDFYDQISSRVDEELADL